MLLNELLDRKIPYKVVLATDTQFRTSATVGGRNIVVRCSGMTFSHNSLWVVDFAETTPGGSETFMATGSGSELEVFSLVVDSLKELVARYQPDQIRFTASKKEGDVGDTRASLYGRLARRFKLPEYDLVSKEIGSDHVFELIHKDAEEKARQGKAEYDARRADPEFARAEAFRRQRERLSSQTR